MKKNNIKEINTYSLISFAFGLAASIGGFIFYIIGKINLLGIIIAIMLGPTLGPIILALAFLSIVFGIISLKSEKRNLSIIGIELSVFSIIIFIIFICDIVKLIINNQ